MMFFSRVRIVTTGLDHSQLFRLAGGDGYAGHQLLWKLFQGREQRRSFLFRQEFEREQLQGFEQTRRGLPLFYLVSACRPESIPGLLQVEAKEYRPRITAGMRLAFELRANPTVAKRRQGHKHSAHVDVLIDARRQALLEWLREAGLDELDEKRQRDLKSRLLENCTRDATLGQRMRTLWSALIAAQGGRPHSELSARELLGMALQSLANQSAETWLNGLSERKGFELERVDCDRYQILDLRKSGQYASVRVSTVDYQGVLRVTDPERFQTTLFEGIGRARAFGCGLLMVRRLPTA